MALKQIIFVLCFTSFLFSAASSDDQVFYIQCKTNSTQNETGSLANPFSNIMAALNNTLENNTYTLKFIASEQNCNNTNQNGTTYNITNRNITFLYFFVIIIILILYLKNK